MEDIEKKFNLEEVRKELGKDRITVGLAICGRAAGGYPIYEALQSANLKLPVDIVGCIGMCYNEPIVTVNQGGKTSIYGKVTKDNVDKLIASIKKGEENKKHNYSS